MSSGFAGLPVPPDCSAKYEPLELLGTGGFGVVLLCRHRELGRLSAVKILHAASQADPTVALRLIAEARTTSLLRHPNVVHLLDHGNDPVAPWVAYEYLEGKTLAEHLKGGPLPWREAVRVACEVARALEAAHEGGIIHRDIKPDNVLRAVDGSHKVIDFGIAKWSSGSAVKTEAGLVLGTPAYMCPEQIRGAGASPRFDLYALGVMLFQMVAGHVPFGAERPEVILRMHLDRPVPRLRELASDVPERLERLVDTLLEKEAARSFETARDLLRSLEPLAEEGYGGDLRSTTRLPAGGTGVPASPRRGSTPAALAGLVLAAATLFIVLPGRRPPAGTAVGSFSSTSAAPASSTGPAVSLGEILSGANPHAVALARLTEIHAVWKESEWQRVREAVIGLVRFAADLVDFLESGEKLTAADVWRLHETCWTVSDALNRIEFFSPAGPLDLAAYLPRGHVAGYERARKRLHEEWRRIIQALGAGHHVPWGHRLRAVLAAEIGDDLGMTKITPSSHHLEVARRLAEAGERLEAPPHWGPCRLQETRLAFLYHAYRHVRYSQGGVMDRPEPGTPAGQLRSSLDRSIRELRDRWEKQCLSSSAEDIRRDLLYWSIEVDRYLATVETDGAAREEARIRLRRDCVTLEARVDHPQEKVKIREIHDAHPDPISTP